MYGRRGGDTLKGFGMGDDLFGQRGADSLVGASGGDDLTGGPGNDALNGGGGAEHYFFADGWGNASANVLHDGKGAHTIYGGEGDDSISVLDLSPSDTVHCGAGINNNDHSFGGCALCRQWRTILP
jgi:Ca2+-binding RTX toxin-like protein